MKICFATIVSLTIILCGCATNSGAPQDKVGTYLSARAGVYTYNFSDTDEDAYVEVHFRRRKPPFNPKDPSDPENWVADGKMEDRINKRVVTFSNAFVEIRKNGGVSISAQFVNFTIEGKLLTWRSGYGHYLFKDGVDPDKR